MKKDVSIKKEKSKEIVFSSGRNITLYYSDEDGVEKEATEVDENEKGFTSEFIKRG